MNADVIALDRDGREVLLVEVRVPRVTKTDRDRFLGTLASAPETIAYGMVVDPLKTQVFRRDADGPIAEFKTEAVIRHYYGDSFQERAAQGSARVSQVILTHIIEVWLWDLALPWKGGIPPEKPEMDEIGLLALLEGGSTVNQDMSSAHPLH
jgi:hypothetical protein